MLGKRDLMHPTDEQNLLLFLITRSSFSFLLAWRTASCLSMLDCPEILAKHCAVNSYLMIQSERAGFRFLMG